MKHVRMSIPLIFLLLMFSVSATAGLHISTIDGSLNYWYNANVNGEFPDITTNGTFLWADCDYSVTLDFPPIEHGDFEWYVEPSANIYGMVHGIPIELIVDEDGIFIYSNGEISKDKYWEEFGYSWVEGRGLLLETMATPASAFPADPDRVVGLWEHDLEPDGAQDILASILGSNGNYSLQFYVTRSLYWVGMNGPALVENFADWVEVKLPGVPTDLIREQDIGPFMDMDLMIYALGGAIPGIDISGSGSFSVTIRAIGGTATEPSSWSQIKALY